MANLKSAKKEIRQSARRTKQNQAVRTALKTYVRRVREAIEEGDKDKIQSALQKAHKGFDKAAQNGVIHQNQADRRKSRISQAANKALAS